MKGRIDTFRAQLEADELGESELDDEARQAILDDVTWYSRILTRFYREAVQRRCIHKLGVGTWSADLVPEGANELEALLDLANQAIRSSRG